MVEKTIDTVTNYIHNHKSTVFGFLIHIVIVLIMILMKKDFLKCIKKLPVEEQNQLCVIQIENNRNNVYELTTLE